MHGKKQLGFQDIGTYLKGASIRNKIYLFLRRDLLGTIYYIISYFHGKENT